MVNLLTSGSSIAHDSGLVQRFLDLHSELLYCKGVSRSALEQKSGESRVWSFLPLTEKK